MKIMLAPMEGVVDSEMRAVLTELGGYDRCVTEFVRVTDQLLPNHVFRRFAPELDQGGLTPAGVPVYLQLLGGNPDSMAKNAARVAALSPAGIDLNFGCPSKTVNRNDGGSALLREPSRVGNIVSAVRNAVGDHIPVTAKIRLGFNNADFLCEIAERVELAGASELCIHARTRDDRYKPPAHWHLVKQVTDQLQIPVIINGEIWTPAQAQRALQDSGCQHLMLGRGALSRPDLAACIKAELSAQTQAAMPWQMALELMLSYLHNTQNKHPLFVSNRAKQWLVFLQMYYAEANEVFQSIKRLKVAAEVLSALEATTYKNLRAS